MNDKMKEWGPRIRAAIKTRTPQPTELPKIAEKDTRTGLPMHVSKNVTYFCVDKCPTCKGEVIVYVKVLRLGFHHCRNCSRNAVRDLINKAIERNDQGAVARLTDYLTRLA
jgi:hypothetical protein